MRSSLLFMLLASIGTPCLAKDIRLSIQLPDNQNAEAFGLYASYGNTNLVVHSCEIYSPRHSFEHDGRSNPPTTLYCQIKMGSGIHDLTVRLSAEGCQEYTHLIPNFNADTDGNIELRVTNFSESRSPCIDGFIRPGIGTEGLFYRFTLYNPSEQDLSVNSLGISGYGGHDRCGFPDLHIFQFSRTIAISSSVSGSQIERGTMTDEGIPQQPSYPLRGIVFIDRCGSDSSKMELAAPVSFILPKKSFVSVALVVPQSTANKSHSGKKGRDQEVMSTVALLHSFATLDFAFHTTSRQFPEITGLIRCEDLDVDGMYVRGCPAGP